MQTREGGKDHKTKMDKVAGTATQKLRLVLIREDMQSSVQGPKGTGNQGSFQADTNNPDVWSRNQGIIEMQALQGICQGRWTVRCGLENPTTPVRPQLPSEGWGLRRVLVPGKGKSLLVCTILDGNQIRRGPRECGRGLKPSVPRAEPKDGTRPWD